MDVLAQRVQKCLVRTLVRVRQYLLEHVYEKDLLSIAVDLKHGESRAGTPRPPKL